MLHELLARVELLSAQMQKRDPYKSNVFMKTNTNQWTVQRWKDSADKARAPALLTHSATRRALASASACTRLILSVMHCVCPLQVRELSGKRAAVQVRTLAELSTTASSPTEAKGVADVAVSLPPATRMPAIAACHGIWRRAKRTSSHARVVVSLLSLVRVLPRSSLRCASRRPPAPAHPRSKHTNPPISSRDRYSGKCRPSAAPRATAARLTRPCRATGRAPPASWGWWAAARR
jgi:hypothetical protein